MGPRFGVTIIPSASGRSDPVTAARRAEDLGFDLVSVWDHPHGEHPSLETWTLMTWIASRTSRISIASDVLGLPFRLPALVAKMAETLDRLSNGRLILGLGAGGSNAEAAGLGAPVRTPDEKVEALEEALAVIRGVWSEPAFTYDGAYYRNEGTRLEPKPGRAIPIWLGTYGRRGVELAGRLADGWIPSMGVLPTPLIAERMEALRAAARSAGRDPESLDYAFNVRVRVGGGPSPDPDRMIAGEPAEVAEGLAALLGMGFTVLVLSPSGARDEQMERLADEVLPALRPVVEPTPDR